VLKHKFRKQNQVADVLSRHGALLTTMETELIGFDAIKNLYECDDDFWEIVEQLKAPVSGNLDHLRGEYFM